MQVTVRRKTEQSLCQNKSKQFKADFTQSCSTPRQKEFKAQPVTTSMRMSKQILINILWWCCAMAWFFTVIFVGTIGMALWKHQTTLAVGGFMVSIICGIVAVTLVRFRRAIIKEPTSNAVDTFASIGTLVAVLQFIIYILEKLYSITA